MEGLDPYLYLTPDDARAENQQFIEKIRSEGSKKVAEHLKGYARTKVRKESFVRSFFKSKEIDWCELEKVKRHVRYIIVPYKSKCFKCTLAEFATIRKPVLKILDEYILDMIDKEDKAFYDFINDIVNSTGNIHASTNEFTIDDLTTATKKITNKGLKPSAILLSNSVPEDLKTTLATQYRICIGKTYLVPEGELYIFAGTEFGSHYILNDVEVFLECEEDITFFVWENVALTIDNVNGIAKMTWMP